jgi:hypothetical protein
VTEPLGDRISKMGAELRASRAALAELVLEVERSMTGWADAEARFTPRTTLALRAGRLFLLRRGREPLGLFDACRMDVPDVPGWLLHKAMEALPDLVDSESES